jgi:hypothetical protein
MCQMDKLETSTTFGAKYFEHKVQVPARKMCYLEWPDCNSSDYNAGVVYDQWRERLTGDIQQQENDNKYPKIPTAMMKSEISKIFQLRGIRLGIFFFFFFFFLRWYITI